MSPSKLFRHPLYPCRLDRMSKMNGIATLPLMSKSAAKRPTGCSAVSESGPRESRTSARLTTPSTLCWAGDELARLLAAGDPVGGQLKRGGLANRGQPSLLRDLPCRPAFVF